MRETVLERSYRQNTARRTRLALAPSGSGHRLSAPRSLPGIKYECQLSRRSGSAGTSQPFVAQMAMPGPRGATGLDSTGVSLSGSHARAENSPQSSSNPIGDGRRSHGPDLVPTTPMRSRGTRNAPSGWSGRGHHGQAHERGDADRCRSADSESELPGVRGHCELHDA